VSDRDMRFLSGKPALKFRNTFIQFCYGIVKHRIVHRIIE
jgi:hypothetical protein